MYKYRFLELLNKMPFCEKRRAMQELPELLNISETTWRRWVYLKNEYPTELPLFRLEQLSSFFQCTVEELHTTARQEYNLADQFYQSKN